MQRRGFIKACGAGIGCAAVSTQLPKVITEATASPRHYPRVRLVDGGGNPLRAADLQAEKQWVFAYPFKSTPAFLICLNESVDPVDGLLTENGETYQWPGGVGAGRCIVAYSAICAHKLAYPTPMLSYISYRPAIPGEERPNGTITCCAENSRYDPARGAAVVNGPARQPLATILLEHDGDSDMLYATGTLGGELFNRFFSEYSSRLDLEYPRGDAQQTVSQDVQAVPLEEYSGNIMGC